MFLSGGGDRLFLTGLGLEIEKLGEKKEPQDSVEAGQWE